MPNAAEIDPLMLQLDDRGDLRKAVDALQERVFDRLADAAGEGEQFRRRQLLIAEEDHEMIEPGPADGHNLAIVEIGEVDAMDFGADRPGDRADFEGIAAQGQSPAALRNAALIRDCQPGPSSRK